jgi:hypothetical protein
VAEDLTVSRPTVGRRTEETHQRRRMVHMRRFAVAYGLLALAVLGGGALLVAALSMDSSDERAWSSWQPKAEGEARIWEIADHVGRSYRTADGALAARILAGPPSVSQVDEQGQTIRIPLDGVLVKGRASDESDARAVLFTGDSVMFAMCGSGQACFPSNALLRVEELGTKYERLALELALYTFKYVDEVNSVVVFLPPLPQQNAQGQVDAVRTVVYLQRGQLDFELDQPVTATLRSTSGLDFSDVEKNKIIKLVHSRLYSFKTQQAPNGAWILSLEPFQA